MAIDKILFIIVLIIILVIVGPIVMYIRKKSWEIRSNHISVSKNVWLEDMDMIPKQEDSDDKAIEKNHIANPSSTPLDNVTFFNQVRKARSKGNPNNSCTQKSVQP